MEDRPDEFLLGGTFMRYALQAFGFRYTFSKATADIQDPVLAIARSDNGFFFSGYTPNTTVRQSFNLPQGAPLFTGLQSKLDSGSTTYYMPTAWHKECRVFVDQKEGILSCIELPSVQKGITRRIQINGLKNGTVRIYPPGNITADKLHAYINSRYPWKKGEIHLQPIENRSYYIIENITGQLVIAW